MTTNSPNRNVVIVAAGAAFLCLCLCVLLFGGVFAFRKQVVRVVPALEPVLSVAQQDTATLIPTLKPTPALLFTKTPPSTETLARTRTPAPTEPPTAQPTLAEPTATETSSPPQATPTMAPTVEEPTPTQQATRTLSPEIASSMDKIQQQVIDLRGLQPSGTFTRDVVTPAQMREIQIRDFNKDYSLEDTRNDMLELSTLGLLQPGFDLHSFYIDLYSEQVGGQYDQKTKEMYVVGNQFGGMERWTYSHEYTHALQDQNYDIINGLHFDTQYCKQDSERCVGVQALLEGDAYLTMMKWLPKYATAQDYIDITKYYSNFKTPVYDSAPEYMKADFMFAPEAGLKFVQHLFDQGGWQAVDAAYANVPVSSEQIMHPERYPDDKPVIVSLGEFTTTLGSGWQEVDRGVMGEWYTSLILSKGIDASYRLDSKTTSTAAEGWGGDAYATYYNEQSNETVMVLSYEWDTLQDSDEYASALVQYGALRFGQPVSSDASQTTWSYSGGYSIFRQAGQGTVWVMAPDQATAEAVLAAVGP